ncbi:MAG: Protein Kinase C [Candidatus Amesbacteria bacterium GW2011_GWA1_44_24]|nr:MAG: Protein Kinase C [Candidatus Amesbacteria bacterium GW2011_GWA1_44_24]
MDDCIFCKIIKKEAPGKIELENDNLIVIKDIHPKASVHLLLIPKKHVRDITDLDEITWLEIKKMVLLLAKDGGLKNFRIVHNAGGAALVSHMHIHFLAEISTDREI